MEATEKIVDSVLECESFCLEFIDDPEVSKRDKELCSRVLYHGVGLDLGVIVWLVGEKGLSEDGKETLYISRGRADGRDGVKKELIQKFEHAVYVYDTLNEKVLKDERKDHGEIK